MDNKKNSTKNYHILPGPKMGLITPEYLEQVAELVRKHNIPFVKLTGAQRIAIAGHSLDDAEKIWFEMGQERGPEKPVGIHYIQACPGVRWCKYGRLDSIVLGEKIEKTIFDLPLQAKTKVGISGCAMNCCECYIRDIGIFAKKRGWSLVFGGNGGGNLRVGDIVGEGLGDEEVIELARKCLGFYVKHARKFERTARVMRRRSKKELMRHIRDYTDD